MQIQLEECGSKYQLKRFEGGKLTINEEVHETSLILVPDQIYADWPVKAIEQLTPESLSKFFDLKKPDIIIIGHSQPLSALPAATQSYLQHNSIGAECMDHHAACRTYVALCCEQRNVALCMILS